MQKKNTLVYLLRPYTIPIVIGFFGALAFSGLAILPPLLMRNLVDKVVMPGDWSKLPFVASCIILLPIVSALLRFINVNLIVQTSYRFMGLLRRKLFEKILSLSPRYFSHTSSGTISGRLMDDVNVLQRLLTANTIQMFVDALVFIAALVIAFVISWQLALVLALIILLYVLTFMVFSTKIKNATQEYRRHYDGISGRLLETLSGVKQVRIYNREEHETQRFLSSMEEGLDHALEGSLNMIQQDIICSAVSAAGVLAIMFYGSILVLLGKLTCGDLLAMNTFVWMTINPASNFASMAGQLQETFVSVRRIKDLFNEQADICSEPGALKIPPREGAIRFDNVRFSYVPGVPLYDKLGFSIPAGTSVALVGPTGCGKTTLVSLLMRYWDIEEGAIYLDDVNIRSLHVRTLRTLFGVVPQTPFVFEGTLRENIVYGRPTVTTQQVLEAAANAELNRLIERLPDGIDTVLGSYGIKLSVGEKQRVSIARAIVTDPLILIMDEATSALDSESEELIQIALAKILKTRTSIVIAHRLTTITSADQILVIDKGAIVEQGNHEQLVQNLSGLYSRFYNELAGGKAV